MSQDMSGCSREMTREEALDRMHRAEEAVRTLAFVVSDIHIEANQRTAECTLLKRQLANCDEVMVGGKISGPYWSNTAKRAQQLFDERNEVRDQLAKLHEANVPKGA